MLAGAKALSLCFFYCNTMSVLLLLEQRKMIFYNKILRSSNIVLRILSALHCNEAQKLSSAYNILPGQSRNIDIKRAVWSSFVRLYTIITCDMILLLFCFLCVFSFRMFSSCLFYSFVFYVCLCCVLFLYFIFVLPHMA